MSSDCKYIKTNMSGSKIKNSRKNYWSPLQCLPDSDNDDDCDQENMDEPSIAPKKVKIPPIKLLIKSSEYVHLCMKSLNISEYSIKKMSIGVKIMCESLDFYVGIINKLNEDNCQYFTHSLKSERAFKVVLYGLYEMNVNDLKSQLNELGLSCNEVKLITKKYDHYTDTIYIVSLKSGSIKLFQLNKNYRSLFHTQVKWAYQRKQKHHLTQCRNCQMFGHSERGCHVKTYCSMCAGSHKTEECINTNALKCANCKEKHKSTDNGCTIRKKYLEMRDKLSNKTNIHGYGNQSHNQNKVKIVSNAHAQRTMPSHLSLMDFPYLPQQHGDVRSAHNNNSINAWVERETAPVVNSHPITTQRASGELFTMEEINSLVMEMIHKLGSCKTKVEQFQAIAQLATKFLYSNVK